MAYPPSRTLLAFNVPDVERNTHARQTCNNQVAANHGLELMRKRGGQVLFGVAPPNPNGPSHRDTQLDQEHELQNQNQLWSPRASGIVLPPSPRSPPAAAGTPPSPAAAAPGASAATSPTPSTSETEAAAAAEATRGAGSRKGTGGDGGGAAGSSAAGISRVRAANPGGEGRSSPPVGGATELRGWWGAGGAGWGSWSHVDMQLVVGQASKHRVRRSSRVCAIVTFLPCAES